MPAARSAGAAPEAVALVYGKRLSAFSIGRFVRTDVLAKRTADALFGKDRNVFYPFMVVHRFNGVVRTDILAVTASNALVAVDGIAGGIFGSRHGDVE